MVSFIVAPMRGCDVYNIVNNLEVTLLLNFVRVLNCSMIVIDPTILYVACLGDWG